MYDYETEKKRILTDEGLIIFLKVRDKAQELLKLTGAFQMSLAIQGAGGDSFIQIAAIEKMVELGELKMISLPNTVRTQERVYIKG